jgi:hypothetical protein
LVLVDHFRIEIQYNEQDDWHDLNIIPLSSIPGNKKSETKADRFIIDDYPDLTWLKKFRVGGYSDIIRIPFRMPPFRTEYIPARIEHYHQGLFQCTVLCQPAMDCNINKGDLIEVEHISFDYQHDLRCITIEERNGFEWVG